jgi:capsular polysaccharide biosynthesis protein
VRRGEIFALRMAESFFRRWPLYLVPLVLLLSLGIFKAKGMPKVYESTGTLNVSSTTLLTDLTDVNNTDSSFDSPAVKTARNIEERMASDSFAESVAEAAGVKSMLESGQMTLYQIRADVGASAAGDTLLLVTGRSGDPNLSQRLASSLITTYTAYVLEKNQSANNAAAKFYSERLAADQTALTKATNTLVTWLQANPEPTTGDRDPVDAVNLQTLQDAVSDAKKQLADDNAKLAQAQLAITSAQTDVAQRLQVADEPAVPFAPEPVRMKQLFTVVMFGIIGLIVIAVALVIAALLDHTVRSRDEVEEACGLEVVASIPARRGSVERAAQRPPAVAELASDAA